MPSQYSLPPLSDLRPERFETAPILKQLARASRSLGELKGAVSAIPNQSILVNSLGMQEAKDSSAIENIVTTHDELFRQDSASPDLGSAQAKEVRRYREALYSGFNAVRDSGLLVGRDILNIQALLLDNNAGYRKVPGTVLRHDGGDAIYEPPSPEHIPVLMSRLEHFINDDALFNADPLVKMALIHYQFESIHPFYDGNGRTGRILNVLYLVKNGLLDIPVLYMSRRILGSKDEYYRRLQAVRAADAWEDWVHYMLSVVDVTASETNRTIQAIKRALLDYKHRIRARHKFYSQDLINNLFTHPYTKIAFVQKDLGVTRLTATRYLDALVADGFVKKKKVGRTNYYINIALNDILTGESAIAGRGFPAVSST